MTKGDKTYEVEIGPGKRFAKNSGYSGGEDRIRQSVSVKGSNKKMVLEHNRSDGSKTSFGSGRDDKTPKPAGARSGAWQVRPERSAKGAKVFATKTDAIKHAVRLADSGNRGRYKGAGKA